MSWNKGNDEASTSSYERARAFYEAALGLVAFVPPSGDRVQKVRLTLPATAHDKGMCLSLGVTIDAAPIRASFSCLAVPTTK